MRKTKKQRFRASILAFLLIASMVLGMAPGSAGQVYAKESTSQTSSEEEPGFIDKAVGFFKDTGEKIASFFGAGDEAQPAAAFDETSVVDEDTKGSWTGIVEDSTQNIGRIWTDKSVYNSNVTLPGIGDGASIPITKPKESDFMVGLSALSSTSNTSVTTSTPLDIVLVLDVSGSMSNNLGTSYVYSETYDIRTSGWRAPTYYALDPQTGTYVEIKKITSGPVWDPQFDHWELNGDTVEPKTSRDDNDPNHIQFYTRSSEDIFRIDALKDAAGAFVDATAVQNQGINEANQHRLSVVTFSDNGNVAQRLTACNANNAQTIKNTIDRLSTGGNTYPGNAMRSAQEALSGARDGAQKVVIFFTDGNPAPAGKNDFNESMANDGVQGALTLKNNKTKIFSIGIFEGADPGNTSTGTNNQFNAYMHAMSSNYPNATAWNQLGERSTDKLEYYYAATSSDELSEIFQHISEEINTGTGYPTETQDGFANKSGYVTFHDQLGDYMQVDSFNNLILEDITFEPAERTEANGVFTYTYKGSAGENKNVSDIVIEVTPGTGSKGDTVDVRIPAALLPLRHFKVDVSGNTMTVEDKYPLRLFYNVSLKEDAKKALANPDQEMKNYIAKNTKGGDVYFYSNKFTGNKQGSTEGETLGDTTATFEPATGNSFYYFTENTPLYADKEMKTPLTRYNADGTETYYYAKTYYELVNGAPKEVTEAVSFRSHPRDEIENWVGNIGTDEQLYIKAGAPRLTRIHDLTSGKETNVTGTATEVITPNWDDEQAQRNIEVSLGNNGRLAVELPGTLEIKKTVTSEVEAPKDKEFTFTLTLKNIEGQALTGEFGARKFDAQGAASGDPVKVQNNGTVTLKDGESVKIYGLSNGDTYSIKETEIPKGFTAKDNPIQGTIKGNETVTAAFENTYAVTPVVLEGDSSIRAKKILTGRDWLDSDSFDIALISIENAPLPEASEGITIEGDRAIKKVTKGDKDVPDAFDFGKITFTKPGTYTYNIVEPRVSGGAMIPGIDYSGAVYRVDVVVTDNGEGTLSATSTMKQMLDDQGQRLGENGGGIADEDGIAEITNAFNAESVSWGARARKEYIDHSGAYPLSSAKEKFSFKVETVVEDGYEQGPLPGGQSSYTVSCGVGGQISFGQATFGSEYVGKKFLYKITEVLPEGVDANHLRKDGMTYDATEYYLELSFDSVEAQDGGQIMRVTPKYMKVVDGQRVEVSTEDGVVFKNEYRPTPVVVGDETNAAIEGSKTLNGRAMKENEFSFELTAGNQAAINGLTDNSIVFGTDTESNSMTTTAPAADNGAKADFAFGQITFTKPGIYTFNMKEVIPDPEAGGLTYDMHTEVVTVEVTDPDKNGVLTANTTYDADGVAFVNTYGAGTGEDDIAAQILATKKLTGRDMKADEFQFEVVTRKATEKAENFKEEVVATGTNAAEKADAAGTVTFAGKDEKLTYTVESLNEAVEAGYAVKEVKEGQSVWTVSYTARELTDKLPGGVKAVEGKISYDFTIVVTDNNNGTLTAQVQAPDGGIAFENAYTTGGTEVDTDPTDATAYFNKVLTGRDWSESDEFTFTIAPQDGAPAPGKTTATVKKADAKAGDPVPFGFGKIMFIDKDMAGATADEDGTLSKTFTYQITENDVNAEAMPGVTKDNHVATLTITVTDNQKGQLSTTAGVTVANGTFTNTYESSLDYTAVGGLQITKVLNGRDMEAGQFTFTVTPEDQASADKLGLAEGATEFTNTAKAAGETDTMDVLAGKNVTFTQKDAGKTFTYTVAEKEGDNKAYTYDDTPRTVTIEVEDNKNATLTVTTTVKMGGEVVDTQSVTTGSEGQKKATVAFVNTYNDKPETLGGDGEVKINATKSLTNRPMVADEFKFHVKDNKGDTVTSGTNSTDGTITFAPVTYDTDKLIADEEAGIAKKSVKEGAYVYTYDYKVVEDDSNFADGVTGIHTSFPIKVIVTDDGKGNLSIEVVYPEGSENVLTFKNIYGADESAVLNINGHKTLEVESGTNAPDITGKYTFTIEGSEGAPMPEKTTATNDKTGNVDFGAIQYTMENVFGSEPAPLAAETKEADEAGAEPTDESDKIMPVKSEERTKEFTYTVKESGNVPGVHNDSDKTFKVTVTDNGDGTITVDGPKEFAFEFTNTYSVAPVDYSINTDLTINKELDGRELREGEFTFELVGEDKKVVSTAQNSADGSVTFGELTYKVPETYNYVIREKNDKAGGVEYDSAEHTVAVIVTDNGDGTLSAKTELKSRNGEDAKDTIVFKNSYTAQPASVTLGASKAYVGGELEDGQFTFELKDKDGKVVSKAKNTKEGQIVFETISYDQAGTYEYKISEVNDEQKDVTYDKTVYGVTVTVTDNQQGSLMAAVEYDGGKAPVFTNKYSKPAKPAKPEEPKGPTAVKTGDEAPVIPFIILMVATLAIIVTITFIFFRRKRR